jgi:hypothetical protein
LGSERIFLSFSLGRRDNTRAACLLKEESDRNKVFSHLDNV